MRAPLVIATVLLAGIPLAVAHDWAPIPGNLNLVCPNGIYAAIPRCAVSKLYNTEIHVGGLYNATYTWTPSTPQNAQLKMCLTLETVQAQTAQKCVTGGSGTTVQLTSLVGADSRLVVSVGLANPYPLQLAPPPAQWVNFTLDH